MAYFLYLTGLLGQMQGQTPRELALLRRTCTSRLTGRQCLRQVGGVLEAETRFKECGNIFYDLFVEEGWHWSGRCYDQEGPVFMETASSTSYDDTANEVAETPQSSRDTPAQLKTLCPSSFVGELGCRFASCMTLLRHDDHDALVKSLLLRKNLSP